MENKTNDYVLTMDFGTQSLRVSLIDKDGNICAIKKCKYEPCYFSSKKGYAEQDPDYYYDVLVSSLKELTSENQDKLPNILAATITTFRDSSVQLDDKNKPVRKSILWLDQRTAEAREKLPILHRFLFKLVGMKDTVDLNRKRTMAHWLKENEKTTWSKTKKYVNISGYLTYKITGKLVDSPSSVTGHYPIYFKKRRWYKEGALKGRIYGIPSRMLPELKQPGELLGFITDSFAESTGLPKGLKLIATGSDKACETIGLGALNPRIAAISYGTASTIEVSNKKFHNPEKFLPAYPAAVPGYYNMEVQIYRGYWMIPWFGKEFARDLNNELENSDKTLEEYLNMHLLDIPPGSDGLVLQPYWGPGLRRPLSRGSIVGFSDVHTRDHFYRAIIEGIAYALREGMDSIELSQKKRIKEIRISGGGSQSDAICQITADVFGLPVYRVQTFETTSLGAAVATFTALGVYSSVEEAIEHMVRKGTTFLPNEVSHQQYNYLYRKVYLKLFPRLKHIYSYLKSFGK